MKQIDFMMWICAFGMLCACSSKESSMETGQKPYLTDSLKQVVSVETVNDTRFADELILNGQVQSDPNKVAHVFPMFGGMVVQMNATVGDYVHKGQVLAVVRSGEVADYAKQRNEAELQILTAQRDSAAIYDMYKGGMASGRELLQADKGLKNAIAESRRLDEIYTINHITGNSTYSVTAPISGFVLASNVSPNMQIRPDQDEELFTISDLDNVWIIANVYEKDISKVREGIPVWISTLVYGADSLFAAKIDKVYPVLDAGSKTESVRIDVPNSHYRLKPEMFANVYVDVAPANESYPAVPAEAVVFDDDQDYVVTVGADRQLAIQKVHVLKETRKGITYIDAGLKAGDKIIVHNALLIYNWLK